MLLIIAYLYIFLDILLFKGVGAGHLLRSKI